MTQEPNYKAELVGVFGHPVAENPTIVMIEAAFRDIGLNWRYLTIEVYPEEPVIFIVIRGAVIQVGLIQDRPPIRRPVYQAVITWVRYQRFMRA